MDEPMDDDQPVISAENVTRVYKFVERREGLAGKFRDLISPNRREQIALTDFSFGINRGEFVGLIGPNGAGKTTLIKILSGIIRPTSGQVSVLGQTPTPFNQELKRKFALVMGQKSQLWWDLPAIDTFNLNREIYGIPKSDFKSTLDMLVDTLEVGSLLTKPVRQLSLGERMKMELISSLAHQPSILYLDEPTIGLDAISQQQIRSFLKEINVKHGVTILLTSHYMDDIKKLCRRVILVNHGQRLYDGELDDLLKGVVDYKLVTVHFGEEPPSDDDSSFDWMERDAVRGILRVDSPKLQEVLQRLLSRYVVKDLTVEDEEIESLIHKIYRAELPA
jgi:ABC-2 type transport system ATP-binding protein